MKNIFGMNLIQLEHELQELNIPKFRAKQIIHWMYEKNISDFSQMKNLGKELQVQLAEHFCIQKARSCIYKTSADGKTTKFLLEYADGTTVETVLMRHSYGNSICVSSQAGCNIGCKFCASTVNGMARNLSIGDILAQAYYIKELLAETDERISHIVMMGSGEPLLNYDNVLRFIRLVHEEYCLGISYRNITLSTSGIVPRMYDLAEEQIPITLAISLHAPEDELRSSIMPINKRYPLADVVEAGINYAQKTNRQVTYEYILIDQLNDSVDDAKRLAKLLYGQLANVNLIPINSVAESKFQRPSTKRCQAFLEVLSKERIVATIRQEMGGDIDAACGQLRNKYLAR